MARTHTRFIVVTVLSLMLVSAIGGTALAAKGGGGHGGHAGTSGGSSTLELVLLDSTDGQAHWGQQVTFNVSTTVTDQPHVSLQCVQNGALVYTTQTGYYADYPWPWTQIMTLSSGAWTGGAADCTAKLYYFAGKKTPTLATLTFPVLA